ncbi:MAG: hypothetical protein GDA56_13085 [Hormoscilla sp. GM7CHS1pb]|nr:hypothetical protein [Hormoscilla sp. GM7CHS1pb]
MIINLLICLVIAVGISALGIFLAGLPGIFILWLSQPAISLLFGGDPLEKIQSEAGFALIIWTSMLWSLSIYPGYWVAFVFFHDYAKRAQIAIFVGVLYIVSIIIATLIYGCIYLFYEES